MCNTCLESDGEGKQINYPSCLKFATNKVGTVVIRELGQAKAQSKDEIPLTSGQ